MTRVPAVAATFTDHRRGFPRNCRFIDGGNAFDHIAVRRDAVSGFTDHKVSLFQLRGRHLFLAPILEPACDRVLASFSQAFGLSFAPALSDGFGEVGEQDREPQPDG
jgi:hypothetical protein